MSGRLMVGAAAAPITPGPGMEMSGFAARTQPASGVLDELWARAVSFSVSAGGGARDGAGGASSRDRVALVSLDLLGVDAELVAAIRREAVERAAAADLAGGLAPERIIVSATHTHAGPAVLSAAFLGSVDRDYLARVASVAAAAIVEAAKGEASARPGVGAVCCAGVGSNRREHDGPVDRRLLALRADSVADGRTIAVVVNYACHAVALGPQNTCFSSDYVHFVRLAVERAFPGSVALFANGASGNVNTGHTAQASIAGGSAGRTYADAEHAGAKVGQAAVAAATAAAAAPPAAAPATAVGEVAPSGAEAPVLPLVSAQMHLPLQPAAPADAYLAEAARFDGFAVAATGANPGLAAADRIRARWARQMAAVSAAALPGLPTHIWAEVTAFRIGPALFVTFPGEAFVEFGILLRQRFAGTPLFVLGYTGGAVGYVPTPEAMGRGGYEVDDSYRFYGLPAPYSAEAYGIAYDTAVRVLEAVSPRQ